MCCEPADQAPAPNDRMGVTKLTHRAPRASARDQWSTPVSGRVRARAQSVLRTVGVLIGVLVLAEIAIAATEESHD